MKLFNIALIFCVIVFFSSADHTVDQIVIRVYDVDSTLINNVNVADNYNGKVKNYSIDKFSYVANDVPLGQHFFSAKIIVNKIYRDFEYKKGIPVN